MLPLIVFEKHIRVLFWFGDEFDLLKEFSERGSNAFFSPFGENFCPFFKIVWFQSIFWLDSTYFSIISVFWMIHVIVVLFFYRLLMSAGFNFFESFFSAAILGIIPTNIETLTWSVQMSATLSMLYFVIGCHFQLKVIDNYSSPSMAVVGGLFMCSLLSALSFSRGVLTGLTYLIHTVFISKFSLQYMREKYPAILACLLPPIIVITVIFFSSPGNHSDVFNLLNSFWKVVRFSSVYFFYNPFLMMLNFGWSNDILNIVIGMSKLLIITIVFFKVDSKKTTILLLLLIFDLGNSILLGLGRFHTGYLAATSSRYQYASLICFLPFLACFVQLTLDFITNSHIRQIVSVSLVLFFLIIQLLRWNSEIKSWVNWRGQEIRNTLERDKKSLDSGMAPCVPESMKISTAMEIIKKFNLK